ncbi:MAG: hypothetical protein KDI59_03025 [Xanthomonadales bacterium]|nr:hypothetical protein [Xanthomonadales bacterium]
MKLDELKTIKQLSTFQVNGVRVINFYFRDISSTFYRHPLELVIPFFPFAILFVV